MSSVDIEKLCSEHTKFHVEIEIQPNFSEKLNVMIEIAQMNPNQRIHQELEENGYIIINLLNENEVQSLLNFDKNSSIPNDLADAPMCFSMKTSEVSYRQLISEEIKRLFAPKLAILLPKHRISNCNFARKKANLFSSIMLLHQDPSLVNENYLDSFGVWCPLIDVNEQNGCLQVIRKSHQLNSKPRPIFVFNGFPYSQDILSLMQQRYLTSIPMKAGQALIYDKRLFHGSPPNLTTVERVAAICSLVPEKKLTHLCYRESPTSDKIELFEVDDEFYERYIIGQKPEGVKSLGIFDYEVEPLTPENLMEKLEENSQLSSTNNQVLSPQSQGWMLTAQQLQDELTQTQAELKKSNEQLHQTQDQLEELKIQQSQTQDELEELKIQQFQTQAELEQSQTQLQTQLTEFNEQLHQKTRELSALKEEHSQARSQLEREREQLQTTQTQLEQYRQQLQKNQADWVDSHEKLHQKTRELEALKEEHSQVRSQLEREGEKLQTTEAELEAYRQQLNQARSQVKQLESQQQQDRAELEQSRQQLRQTQAQLQQSDLQLHATQAELEQSQAQLHQKTVELQKVKSQQHQTRLAQIIQGRIPNTKERKLCKSNLNKSSSPPVSNS
ncbi:phytanoyl-CoA dioxygenase family protein [Microcoleus sp. B5-D4]|uniref:phytanoyl-CoA dioxygenase family protein n=1 Tax=unclassified Microcoleus TaxID=2642155 RepID=UPI002FD1A1C4